MIEAVVAVALRAILASVILGAVLSALVFVVTRRFALTAATRHALWTTAMIATAVMPLSSIAVSLVRAAPVESNTAWHAPVRNVIREQTTQRVETPATLTASAGSSKAVSVSAVSVADGLREGGAAIAGWTPRVTRALALGIVVVWALGALVGMIGLAASLWRIRGLKRRSSPLEGALADDLPWLTAANAGREIYLRLSYEIETPVAVGFGRPVILVPTELTGDGGLGALEPLVLHEHAHLRRYDDWTNLIQRTIERLFWFNPLVWIVGRRIALEREIASDDAVVERTGEAHAYATSLWKLAREMRMPEHAVVAPGALLTRKQIAVRIEQLLDANRGRLHRSPVAALVTACAGIAAVAFVATSAPAVELPGTTQSALGSHVTVKSKAPPHVTARVARATVAVAHPTARVEPKPVAAENAKPAPAPAKSITKIVYVRVPAPAGTSIGSARASASTGASSSAAATAVVPPLPPREFPAAPSVAPMPPVHVSGKLSPETISAIQRAAATHGTVSAAIESIGPTVDSALSKALAQLPRQLAQINDDEAHGHRAPPKGATLSRELLASCVGCSFHNADLRGLDLHGLTLKGDDFDGTDLRGANLNGAHLSGVSLRGTNLAGADLRGAVLSGVDLHGVTLTNARVDDISLLGISLRGAGLTGVPMRTLLMHCSGCDLTQMDLHGIDLHGLSLVGADLSGANLSGVNLSGAHLSGVDLSNANLSGANLTNVHFDGCDLRGAVMRDASSTGMRLSGSSLSD